MCLCLGDEHALVCTFRLARLAAGEREGREDVTVEVVVDVEVTGEPGSGVFRLIPGTPTLPFLEEPATARARRVVAEPGELQREHRPRGLRWRARPDPGEGLVDIGVARLAPASFWILHPAHPPRGPAHHVVAAAHGDECADHAPRTVDVVDTPAPVTGPPGPLGAPQIRKRGCYVAVIGSIADGGEHLDDVRSDILGRRVEHRP